MTIPFLSSVLAAVLLFAVPSAAAQTPLERITAASQDGRRLIVFFFCPEDQRAPDAAALMHELHMQRRQYNYEIIAVVSDAERRTRLEELTAERGFAFPVVFDEGATVAERFNMPGDLGFVLINEHGRPIARRLAAHTPAHVSLRQQWQTHLSTQLNMHYIPYDQPVLGLKPAAPGFKAVTVCGRQVSLADLHANKPLVLAIFSPRCPSCITELKFLNSLYTGELRGRFEILALSLMAPEPTAQFVREASYEFPVVSDPARRIAALFPSFVGSVPTTYIINAGGEIEHVHVGFNNYLMDVYRMHLRKLAGVDNPPLLITDGYSGEKRCAVCHEQQHLQWSQTSHAAALSSLQRKGETENPACIACHVTGYGQPGGYHLDHPPRYLENVQCESCHGPGYQSCSGYTGDTSPPKSAAQWRELCVSCHTEKESLNFVFPRRFVQVRHSAMPDLDGLDRNERLALLNRSDRRQNPFDNPARYMGAESCRECHAAQYEHWQSTVHAGLEPDKASEPEKLYRYVTGMGAEDGYPEPGRTGVQCEACHGPAERHLQQPEARGHSYIVGLGAECPSCVVEQICMSCHSVQNDPDFDFDQAIQQMRHPNPDLQADP